MMKSILILTILLSSLAFSVTIDERKTDIYFANGIMNEKEDADKIKA